MAGKMTKDQFLGKGMVGEVPLVPSGVKLTAECIPVTTFGRNLRSMVPRARWDKLRRAVYRRAGYKCEVCGGVGKQHPVECHEVWEYDKRRRVQKLKGLIALCPSCHSFKHLGRVEVVAPEKMADVMYHAMKVNGWSQRSVTEYLKSYVAEYGWIADVEWKVDIDTFLETCDV